MLKLFQMDRALQNRIECLFIEKLCVGEVWLDKHMLVE